LKSLIKKNIVIKKDNDNGVTYRFQKDFYKWKPLSKKITLPKKVTSINTKESFKKPTIA
jgi:hypothetical protein